jgi:hypothetical protein
MQNLVLTSLILIALTVGISQSSDAQWVQTNGPYGGTVNALMTCGTNLFAGSEGSYVFLSTNNGESWKGESLINNLQTVQYVHSFEVTGNKIFAGTGSGVFLSTNSGSSWTPVDSGLTNISVLSLAVSDTVLFAGMYSGGLFRSTNSGTIWTAANTGFPVANVNALATPISSPEPTSVFCSLLIAVQAGHMSITD